MQRRTLIQTALASLAGGLPPCPPSRRAHWPTGKAITYLVPFPAGGTTDVLAPPDRAEARHRRWAPRSSSTTRAARAAASAPRSRRAPRPTATRMLGGTISSHAINVSLYPKIGYDPQKSFAPVTLIGTNPVVLVVNQASPYKTLKDVLDASKAKAAAACRRLRPAPAPRSTWRWNCWPTSRASSSRTSPTRAAARRSRT